MERLTKKTQHALNFADRKYDSVLTFHNSVEVRRLGKTQRGYGVVALVGVFRLKK